MPFGDSITDGYNRTPRADIGSSSFRSPHRRQEHHVRGVGLERTTVDGAPFPQNHEGHSGWTIAPEGGRSGISTLVSTVMPQYKPDVVLLMIGTNDAIDNYDMANAPTGSGR